MEIEIQTWIKKLVLHSFEFQIEDESERVCELLGFIKAGQCFLKEPISTQEISLDLIKN